MARTGKKPKKVKWSSKPFEKERAEFFAKQSGKCAICGKPESEMKMRMALDHSHKTLQLRGLLCYRCNKFFVGRHTLESATKLAAYLEVERGFNGKA